MAVTEKKLVQRSQRVAFMDVGTGDSAEYTRMTGFTALTNGKNPKEYSRQYVDENTERSDVVGYSPSIEYSFDRHTNTAVHDKIAEISDKEKVGSDTHVSIVVVDLFAAAQSGAYPAIQRTYAVIPDSDGDGTDALIYSGTFKAVSEIVVGTATSNDNWQTATFTAAPEPDSDLE